MLHSNPAKAYHSLIHLGCGAAPNLGEYCALAEHVWLIDADTQALDTLENAALALEHVHTRHALADTKKRPGTFYRYSLPWASGLSPVDDATQRLYPGLRCLDRIQQLTTPVDALLAQCLQEHGDSAACLLLLDVGRHNAELLEALEESCMLGHLETVVVLSAQRHAQPVATPPSLYGPATTPKGLTLPKNSQILQRHPLLAQTRQQLAERDEQLAERTQQRDEKAQEAGCAAQARDELKQQLELRTQERDQAREQAGHHQQGLENTKQQLAERDKRLAERTQQRDEKARQTESAAKALEELKQQLELHTQERDQAREQAGQHQQALEKTKQQLAERERQGDDLARQLEEARQQTEHALNQNHLNYEAKEAAQARLVALEKELEGKRREKDTHDAHQEDGFYHAFEDRFRGSRDEIKRRVSVYLPFVTPIAQRHPGTAVLDLGCGRGEWLELLREAGLEGDGVDLDPGMLEAARAQSLNVIQGDALAFLEQQPEASRICISMMHVAEHLPFDIVRRIVGEAKRVLVPDGILLMETPNPENFLVGSCNFYMDPTHRNPLPPPLLAFVPEYYGFEKVKILRLQESEKIKQKTVFDVDDFLTKISPDYAVVARASVPREVEFSAAEAATWGKEYGLSLSLMIERNASEKPTIR